MIIAESTIPDTTPRIILEMSVLSPNINIKDHLHRIIPHRATCQIMIDRTRDGDVVLAQIRDTAVVQVEIQGTIAVQADRDGMTQREDTDDVQINLAQY